MIQRLHGAAGFAFRAGEQNLQRAEARGRKNLLALLVEPLIEARMIHADRHSL